jgi:hypothetical protein
VERFVALVDALQKTDVRFVVMGVWGINYYAQAGGTMFTTVDRDLFIPPDPSNLLRMWDVCDENDLALWVGQEPLDRPRDLMLAQRVVELRAVTSALGESGLQIDLSLVMAGFAFDDVWARRRHFRVEGVSIPVASLSDIVQSKAIAGRDKDRLFLATHKEAIEHLRLHDENP